MVRDLYNPDVKERFIVESVLTKGSQNSYEYVLSKAYKWESRLGKDLCDFSHSEYDLVLSDLQAKSEKSIQYQHSILESYISFAIKNGFSGQETNFASVFTREMLNNYIDKIYSVKKIISKEDLEEIISLCQNMQDSAPIVLMCHVGISGDMEEIRNLKGEDIKRKEGVLILTRNDGSKRKVKIQDKYLEIIENAYEDTEYKKNNGEQNPDAKSFTVDLEESEYVLKNVKRKKISDDKITSQSVRQRVRKVASWWDNKFITPTSLMVSGMIEYTKQYMLIHNKKLIELETYDYIKITKRFGIDEKNWFTNKKRILQHLKD